MPQYIRRERATRILAGLLANQDIEPGLVNLTEPSEMEQAKIKVLVASALAYVDELAAQTRRAEVDLEELHVFGPRATAPTVPPPEPMDDETKEAFDELLEKTEFDVPPAEPRDLLDPLEARRDEGGGICGMRGYGTLQDASAGKDAAQREDAHEAARDADDAADAEEAGDAG